MDNIERKYAAFERAMDEEKVYRKVSDYSEICAMICVDPLGLDKVLYEELGWHGQALVDFYRLCENIHKDS